MRLAEFIADNVEVILAEWEVFAASIRPEANMTSLALRDHAPQIKNDPPKRAKAFWGCTLCGGGCCIRLYAPVAERSVRCRTRSAPRFASLRVFGLAFVGQQSKRWRGL